MEIDESILDEEDGDDISIRGRESISSLFVRACGIGPEDVFEDQKCDNTPSSTAHMPLTKSGFPHACRVLPGARGPQELDAVCQSGNGEGGISFGSFEVKGDSRQLEVQNFVHFQLFISIFTF